MTQIKRPNFHRFHNGSKAALPFCHAEYETRLAGLRNILRDKGVNAAVFTSMHNIAYYSGFLYCAFGRPYALVVTATDCVTIPPASTAASHGAAALVTTLPILIGSAITTGAQLPL